VVRVTPIICARNSCVNKKIGTNKFMHPQKPFAGAGLDVVSRIASDVLLHLSQEELIIFCQHRPEGRKRVRLLAQMV
jgi:hypothetical protein